MRFKFYVAFISERFVKTQFGRKILTNYTTSDISTQILVLLPVDVCENYSVFTKRLEIMINVIVYSYPMTFMNSFEIFGKHYLRKPASAK